MTPQDRKDLIDAAEWFEATLLSKRIPATLRRLAEGAGEPASQTPSEWVDANFAEAAPEALKPFKGEVEEAA